MRMTFDEKIKPMEEEDSFIKKVSLFIIWLQPAVMLSSSQRALLSLSPLHYFEDFALKTPTRTEQFG